MSARSADALANLALEAVSGSSLGDVEVYISSTRRSMARFAIGDISQPMSIDEPLAQVRVALGTSGGVVTSRASTLSGIRVGEASTSDLTRAGVEAAIALAADLAELSPPRSPFGGFARAGEGGDPAQALHLGDRWSQRTADISAGDLAKALAPALAICRAEGLIAAGALQAIEATVALVTSRNVVRTHQSTVVGARIWALETAGSGGASGFDSAMAREIDQIDLARLARRAAADAADARRSRKTLPAGVYDVVLEPEAVASLVEWLGTIAFCAPEVEDGTSFLAGRAGSSVTGPLVTIADDPLADHPALSVAPFDREGSPRRKVVCIDRGVAGEVLHDRTTALRVHPHARSTGSAANRFGGGVAPAPSALSMAGGEAESVKALLGQLGRGLHIRRFHYVNGFLEPRRAVMTGLTRDGTFLVEDGARVASVGNLRFTDSIVEAFHRIEAATRATTAVSPHDDDIRAIRAPAVLIRGLSFTSGTPPDPKVDFAS